MKILLFFFLFLFFLVILDNIIELIYSRNGDYCYGKTGNRVKKIFLILILFRVIMIFFVAIGLLLIII